MCASCSSSSCSSTCSLTSYFDSASASTSTTSSDISSVETSPSQSPSPRSSLKIPTSSELDVDDNADYYMNQDMGFAHSIIAAEARSVLQASERLRSDQHTKSQFSKALQIIQSATRRTGLVDDLDHDDALELIVERRGKVVWSGVGKSVEALHGDLGMLSPGRDVLIAISHSGGSPELQALLPHIKRRRCPLIAFTAKKDSPLGKAADAWVDCRTASREIADNPILNSSPARDSNSESFRQKALQRQQNQARDVRIQHSPETDSFPLNDAQSISLEEPVVESSYTQAVDVDEDEEGSVSSSSDSSTNSQSRSGVLSNSASTSTSNVSTPSLVSGDDYLEPFSRCNINANSSKASSTENVATPSLDLSSASTIDTEQNSQIDETCEAFPHAPAPTCSTSVAMAMGDALVVASARADARAERLTKESFRANLRRREEEKKQKAKALAEETESLQRELKDANETIRQFKEPSPDQGQESAEEQAQEQSQRRNRPHLLKDARQFLNDRKLEMMQAKNDDELDAKGLRYAFARNHPGGSLGKELEMEAQAKGQELII